MAVLEKHTGIYTGTLGTIRGNEHRIRLHPDTKPISEQPNSGGTKSSGVLEEVILTRLGAGITEPVKRNW